MATNEGDADPLIPNATTIAAMREARAGNLETVSFDQIQAVLDADDCATASN